MKPCYNHCFSLTYFQSNMKTHDDLARRLFTFKRFQCCRFQNTFQSAFSPTCRSRLLFASLRERRKFGVDRRITINMEVNLFHSVVPQACNVILQCMHIYKVILSHSNSSSSARRLELHGRVYTITISIKSLNNHVKSECRYLKHYLSYFTNMIITNLVQLWP